MTKMLIDKAVSIEHAEYANKRITDAKLIRIDNAWGHVFWLDEQSDRAISQLIRFIEE